MSGSENESDGNPKFKIFDGFNINEKIAQTVSTLENKYLKITINIGIAFLILQVINTAYEVSYLKGKQESFKNTVNTLLEDRQEVLDELKEQNYDLRNENLELLHLKVENERLKMQLEATKVEEN